MSIKNVLASVAVKDVNSASSGTKRSSADRPRGRCRSWQSGISRAGAGLQVYELKERAGSGSFTFVIRDFEDLVARLQKLSIDVSHKTVNERVRTVMITDPDGNHIAFAEALDPALLR